MMKCIRCGNEVTKDNGYEIESGGFIHHGCAMLMDETPRRKMAISLKDLLAAKKKIDEINVRLDRKRTGK